MAGITEVAPVALLPNFFVQKRVLRPFRFQTGGTILVTLHISCSSISSRGEFSAEFCLEVIFNFVLLNSPAATTLFIAVMAFGCNACILFSTFICHVL